MRGPGEDRETLWVRPVTQEAAWTSADLLVAPVPARPILPRTDRPDALGVATLGA